MKKSPVILGLCCSVLWQSVAVLSVNAQIPDQESQMLLDEIRDVWQKRENRFRSGIVKWTEETIYLPALTRESKELSGVQKCELIFRGDRGHWLVSGEKYSEQKTRLIDSRLRIVATGTEIRQLFDGDDERLYDKYPAGFILKRTSLSHGVGESNEVAIATFRPLAENFGWYVKLTDPWKLTSRTDPIEGAMCVRLEREESGGRMIVWLDPARDYLLVRRVYRYEDQVVQRLDVNYSNDEKWGWIPHDWRILRFGFSPHRLQETRIATVTQIELNRDVPEESFVLEYQPGTTVRNVQDGTYGIVREDGSFRQIEPAELVSGVGYETLMNTESPAEIAKRRERLHWLGRILLLGALMALLLWRLRKRQAIRMSE